MTQITVCSIGVPRTDRTGLVMRIDIQSPIWGIQHLATALNLEIDTAHGYTHRPGFPAPKAPFKQNLWLRDDVLTWFSNLPDRDRKAAGKPIPRGKATGQLLGDKTARPGVAAKRIKGYARRDPK